MAAWDQERERELRQMCAEGYSAGVIAKTFEVTRNSIIGKANRLGLVLNPSAAERHTLARLKNPNFNFRAAPKSSTPYRKSRPSPPRPEQPKPKRGFPKVSLRSRPCTIMGLTAENCHWPLWDDKARFGDDGYGIFCGGVALKGYQYCAHHAHIAWGK
jgi:hypothetical protein